MADAMKSISVPALRRLPLYIEALRRLAAEGENAVSCHDLGRILKQDPTLIRKDFAAAGAEGRPKSGYQIERLLSSLESFLGWDNLNEAFLAGAGNLGRALVGYEGFELRGIKIVAVFDVDKAKIGTEIAGREIVSISKLSRLAQRMKVKTGILTVPASAAQDVAGQMLSGGIEAIWNFTQARLDIPEGVVVENVDLASSLAILCGRLKALRRS